MEGFKYIQVQDVLAMESIRGYYPSLDSMSGCLEWTSGEDMGKYLYATPNWEGEGQCPVSIYTEEGDYRDIAVLKWGDMTQKEQLNKYRVVVEEVISTFTENN